jgi:hypothetical protein
MLQRQLAIRVPAFCDDPIWSRSIFSLVKEFNVSERPIPISFRIL